MLLYCRFSLFLSTQGRVKIHFHALRPCSSLTLCAESGLWLRNALNFSSVIISLLFYIMAADSLRMLCLTDTLMLYLLLASQNGFVAENERVIPNMALTLRWSVISKSHYGLVVSNIYINNTLNILPSYKVETEVVSKLIWHQDEFLIRKSESPRIVPWVWRSPVCAQHCEVPSVSWARSDDHSTAGAVAIWRWWHGYSARPYALRTINRTTAQNWHSAGEAHYNCVKKISDTFSQVG